jgi:hypothetical protein
MAAPQVIRSPLHIACISSTVLERMQVVYAFMKNGFWVHRSSIIIQHEVACAQYNQKSTEIQFIQIYCILGFGRKRGHRSSAKHHIMRFIR